MIKQKIIAILFIVLSVILFAMKEPTPTLILLPIGIYLLCTKENWIYEGEEKDDL